MEHLKGDLISKFGTLIVAIDSAIFTMFGHMIERHHEYAKIDGIINHSTWLKCKGFEILLTH